MLGTPAYDGRVEVGYAHSLVQSISACAARGIALHPVWWPGEALVQHARNMLVQLAIASKVDSLLFVDSDQEWEPQHVLLLLQHPVDVVGAPVRKRTDAEEAYNIRSRTLPVPRDSSTPLFIVDGIGTGFLKLSRRALLAVWESAEPYVNNGQACRMVFDVRVVDGRLMGEDVYLCEQLRALGFKIHVEATANVTHVGSKKFTGDFLSYLARLERGARQEVPPSHITGVIDPGQKRA